MYEIEKKKGSPKVLSVSFGRNAFFASALDKFGFLFEFFLIVVFIVSYVALPQLHCNDIVTYYVLF